MVSDSYITHKAYDFKSPFIAILGTAFVSCAVLKKMLLLLFIAEPNDVDNSNSVKTDSIAR